MIKKWSYESAGEHTLRMTSNMSPQAYDLRIQNKGLRYRKTISYERILK